MGDLEGRSAPDAYVDEYAVMMSGGGMHVRNPTPEVERVYPLAEWIRFQRRDGVKVYRRKVVVMEHWVEVPDSDTQDGMPRSGPEA